MAFKQAAQEAAAAQKSDQERRQMLKDMLELDNKQLIALRKNMADARKNIDKLRLSKGDSYKLYSLYTQALGVASQVNTGNTKVVDDIKKEANAKYDLDPNIKTKIEEYVDELQVRSGSPDTYENFKSLQDVLGTRGSGTRNAKFNKLKQSFAALSQPTQRPLALWYLQQQVGSKFEGHNSDVEISSLNKAFGSKLGIPKDNVTNEYKITSPKVAQRKKAKEIIRLKKGKNLSQSDDNALAAFANVGNLKSKLDQASGANISIDGLKAIRGLKESIKNWEKEAQNIKSRMDKTRANIVSPSAARQPIDIRAGQILLEQNAMANMGKAIEDMPEEDIEAIQLMQEAETFKGTDDKTNQFINAYVKSKSQQKGPSENNISNFIKYVNTQTGLKPDDKRKIKVAALSRILNAQKSNVKTQAVDDFYKTSAQALEKQTQTPKVKPINFPKTVEEAFPDRTAGNEFRSFIRTNYSEYANRINLDPEGSHNNATMKRAFKKYGKKYFQSLQKEKR